MTLSGGSVNLATVNLFFKALEQRDRDSIVPFLDPSVVLIVPFSTTGTAEPIAEFKGEDAVIGYLDQIIANFCQTVLTEKCFFVSQDGNVVFMEAKGDLIQAVTSTHYRNVYVFKFVFDLGKIVHVSEYANPVIFAKLVGMPLG